MSKKSVCIALLLGMTTSTTNPLFPQLKMLKFIIESMKKLQKIPTLTKIFKGFDKSKITPSFEQLKKPFMFSNYINQNSLKRGRNIALASGVVIVGGKLYINHRNRQRIEREIDECITKNQAPTVQTNKAIAKNPAYAAQYIINKFETIVNESAGAILIRTILKLNTSVNSKLTKKIIAHHGQLIENEEGRHTLYTLVSMIKKSGKSLDNSLVKIAEDNYKTLNTSFYGSKFEDIVKNETVD